MLVSKYRLVLSLILLVVQFALLFANEAEADSDNGDKDRVLRRGVFMGLDPGLSVRVDETGTPVYLRLDLRLGGCITPRIQLGVDWRMDLLAGGGSSAPEKRHTIGPVLTLFLIRGWFVRTYVHLGNINPFYITAGAQTGYEFSAGRFGAIGLALGGDADIPFNGEPPLGYSLSAVFYLTAYDLGSRRGREKGL